MPVANPEQSRCARVARIGREERRVDGPFYDALERRDPAERETALMAALPQVIAAAKEHAPAYRQRLAAVRPAEITDRRRAGPTAADPQIRIDRVATTDPAVRRISRRCPSAPRRGSSPRPVRFTSSRRGGPTSFAWRARFMPPVSARRPVAQYLFVSSDPGRGDARERGPGARAPGVPGGTAQTEQQLRAIADLRPVAYVGTPSFLKILLDRAPSTAATSAHLKKALVGAEAFPRPCGPRSRSRGSPRLQCYGTADLGLVAYESWRRTVRLCDGMVVDEGVIVELGVPDTAAPVAPGKSARWWSRP